MYRVLSNDQDRAFYDRHGSDGVLDKSLDDLEPEELFQVLVRELGGSRIDSSDVAAHFAQLSSSAPGYDPATAPVTDVEDQDLRSAYERCKGNMRQIMQCVPCLHPKTRVHVFQSHLIALAAEGKIPSHPAIYKVVAGHDKWAKKTGRPNLNVTAAVKGKKGNIAKGGSSSSGKKKGKA